MLSDLKGMLQPADCWRSGGHCSGDQRTCIRRRNCWHLALVTMLRWLLHSDSSCAMAGAVSWENFLAMMGHCRPSKQKSQSFLGCAAAHKTAHAPEA